MRSAPWGSAVPVDSDGGKPRAVLRVRLHRIDHACPQVEGGAARDDQRCNHVGRRTDEHFDTECHAGRASAVTGEKLASSEHRDDHGRAGSERWNEATERTTERNAVYLADDPQA